MKINRNLIYSLLTWTLTALAIGILLALLIQALIQDAHADEGDTLKFIGGVIASYAVHETGHFAAAKLTNTEMDWSGPSNGQLLTFREHAEYDSAGLWINASGLGAQALCSEIILDNKKINRRDPFVRGMMFYNVINPILYSVDYFFLHHTDRKTAQGYEGDIQGVEYYSGKRDANLFAATVTLLALYDGYRFLKPSNPESKYRFNLSALPGGGVELGWRISF